MNPTLKPWIRWLLNEEATGLLKKEYDVAIERAGRVCFADATVFGDVGSARTRNDSCRGFSNQPLPLLNSGPFT
jgi:hypothetical protein